MNEGGTPRPSETEIFPVVGEPPPPPGASTSRPPKDGTIDSVFGDDPPDLERAPARAADTGGPSSIAGAGRKVARVAERHLRDESPWVLGSAALLVALAAYWVDSILMAFQHAPAMTGQDRVLLLLVPGTFTWTAGVLLAIALAAAGRHFEVAPARPGPVRLHLPQALLAAASASVTAAGLDVLVELANFGHGIDRAVAGILGYIGAMALAAAAAWWAHRESEINRQRRAHEPTARTG